MFVAFTFIIAVLDALIAFQQYHLYKTTDKKSYLAWMIAFIIGSAWAFTSFFYMMISGDRP